MKFLNKFLQFTKLFLGARPETVAILAIWSLETRVFRKNGILTRSSGLEGQIWPWPRAYSGKISF